MELGEKEIRRPIGNQSCWTLYKTKRRSGFVVHFSGKEANISQDEGHSKNRKSSATLNDDVMAKKRNVKKRFHQRPLRNQLTLQAQRFRFPRQWRHGRNKRRSKQTSIEFPKQTSLALKEKSRLRRKERSGLDERQEVRFAKKK